MNGRARAAVSAVRADATDIFQATFTERLRVCTCSEQSVSEAPMRNQLFATTTIVLCASAALAHAETPATEEVRTLGFVEVFGNWGVNFGQTEFIPDGAPGHSKYPFASGFGGGAAVGIVVLPSWLSIFVDYRYGSTRTVTGELTGALSDVHGELSYHSFTAGVRIERPAWRGAAYAQMAAGALLPFHQTIEFEYAPMLAAVGITGEGTRRDHFGAARGVEAEMGYHFDLPSRFYVGTGIRVATFQASNNGRDTKLDNFVLDFTALPPVAVTRNIHFSKHGGPNMPTTYSVQDIRLNVSVGYRF
ncbi:MAG: hypothetical protein HOV81_13945 [Kofleriaceae bacterium]|nr:hypothetical protein [Kofleriaceae bacterium]